MATPIWVQEDHRWVADDGGVNGGTLLGSGNNEDRSQDVDTVIRLRIVIKETNNKAANNISYELHALKNGVGAWGSESFQVTASSTGVKLTNDSQSIPDNSTTTQRIGDGTYVTGDSLGWVDGTSYNVTGFVDYNGNDEVELEFCLTLPSGSNSNGDYYQFRIYQVTATALSGYPATLPKLTAVAAVIEPLTAAITGNGSAYSTLKRIRGLTSAIGAAGDAAANLNRTRHLNAAVSVTGDITTADINRIRTFTTTVGASGDVTAELSEIVKEQLDAGINVTATVTASLSTTARYWVGDVSGFWNNDSNWAMSSGDTGGAGVPTGSNNVYFDMGYTTQGCMVNVATANARGIIFKGYNGALNGNGNNVNIGAGGIRATASGATLTAGSGTWTITGGTVNYTDISVNEGLSTFEFYNACNIYGKGEFGGDECFYNIIARSGSTVTIKNSTRMIEALTIENSATISVDVSKTLQVVGGTVTNNGTISGSGLVQAYTSNLVNNNIWSCKTTVLGTCSITGTYAADVEFNNSYINATLTIPAGGLVLEGITTVYTGNSGYTFNNAAGGAVNIKGNFVKAGTFLYQVGWIQGSGGIQFTGANNQSYNASIFSQAVDAITVNKTGGRLTLTGNGPCKSFTLSLGDFNLNGYTLTCNGAIIIDGGVGAGRFWNGTDEDMANGKFVIGAYAQSAGTVDGDSGQQLVIDNLDFDLQNSSTITATYCDIGTSDVTGGTGDATDPTNTNQGGNSGWSFGGVVEPLTATITADGDVTANINRTRGVDASITAEGDISADLVRTVAVTANISAEGDAAAALVRTRHFIASIAASGDVTTADLDVGGDKQLTAAITADGDVNSNITYTAALTTAITAAGDVTAAINKTRHFDAAIVAAGDITTADLDVTATKALTAAITADGDLTAELVRTRSIDATITTSGDLAADLERTVAIVVAISATGDVAANLSEIVGGFEYFDATITAEGDLSASITRIRSLATAVTAEGDVNVNLNRTRTLTSALTGSGSLTGDLSVKVPLSVSLDGTGTLAASVYRIRGITVDVSSTGFLTANVVRTRTILADLSADVDVDAELRLQTAISPWFYKPGAINKVLD